LTLARLYAGLRAMQVSKLDAWRLIIKIGFDCLPALRWRVLSYLFDNGCQAETTALATALGYPTQTTRRTLEDLAAHGIVIREKGMKADLWSVPESILMLHKAATGRD
jgi:DNA-binding MarR family transcriptional regulator